MVQKTIWMQLLLIGILSNLVSCKSQVDGRYIEEFYLKNKTGIEITIDAYIYDDEDIILNSFSLKNDSTLVQLIDLLFGSRTGVVSLSDSVSINFSDLRKVQFIASDTLSPYNILNFNNYEIEKISDNYRKLKYTFTEDDLQNANEK